MTSLYGLEALIAPWASRSSGHCFLMKMSMRLRKSLTPSLGEGNYGIWLSSWAGPTWTTCDPPTLTFTLQPQSRSFTSNTQMPHAPSHSPGPLACSMITSALKRSYATLRCGGIRGGWCHGTTTSLPFPSTCPLCLLQHAPTQLHYIYCWTSVRLTPDLPEPSSHAKGYWLYVFACICMITPLLTIMGNCFFLV